MPFEIAVQLLIAFGPKAIALIDKLVVVWGKNAILTPEEWALQRASLCITPQDQMRARLQAAGVALDSELGKALLAQTS